MSPARRLSALACTASLAAALLTGCSDLGQGDGEAAPTPGPDTAMLTDAVAEATSAGSSRISLRSTARVGTQDVAYAGEGLFDYTKKTGTIAYDVPGANGQPAAGGTIEQRVIGADLYLALPTQKGVFYRLKVADVAGTSLGGSADPTAPLQALAGTTALEEVGPEVVRDVETTRYKGEYDVQRALAAAQGAARTILQTALAGTSAKTVPFDAWIDAEGRLVKLTQTLEVPAPPAGGEPGKAQTTVELFDFGTPVTVAAPAPPQVRDGAPLLAALRAAMPKPTSTPAAPATTAPTPAR